MLNLNKFLKCSLLLLILSSNCYAMSYEEHIKNYYCDIVQKMRSKLNIRGPLANELAKYALLRQIHEDGKNRSPNKSCVGMGVGGINGKALAFLGFSLESDDDVYRLIIVRANAPDYAGQKFYMLYGPRANVWNCLAIIYVWDYYLSNSKYFKNDDINIWNKLKRLSSSLDDHMSVLQYIKFHFLYRNDLRRMLCKVNSLYGGNYKLINRQVEKYNDVFKGEKCEKAV